MQQEERVGMLVPSHRSLGVDPAGPTSAHPQCNRRRFPIIRQPRKLGGPGKLVMCIMRVVNDHSMHFEGAHGEGAASGTNGRVGGDGVRWERDATGAKFWGATVPKL